MTCEFLIYPIAEDASRCLFVLTAALLFLGIASEDSGALGFERREQVDTHFPIVYNARIPDEKDLGDDEFHLTAFVDLLDLRRENDGTVTLSFLVHGQHELDFLTSLDTFALEPDADRTRSLLNTTHPPLEKSEGGRNLAGYSTINGFPCYRDLAGIIQVMSDLVKQASAMPGLSVTMKDIGNSYVKTQNRNRGHDIWALNITGNGVATRGMTTKKSVMFVMCGLHARELSPPELGAQWVESLVNGYGTEADTTAMLDHTEVHVVLQSNPDAREIDEVRQNFRRKNLRPSPNKSKKCNQDEYGVDLNRNFPFRYGKKSGSSNNPCSQDYRGEAPASEPEVKAIVNYVSRLFPEDQRKSRPEADQDIYAYPETATGIFVDVHSYGEDIFFPWSHARWYPKNRPGLEGLARKFSYFNRHKLTKPSDYIYLASGATDDWAYGTLGVAAYTFELGKAFYQGCNYFNNNIVRGNLEALSYAAKVSRAPYSLSKGPDVLVINLSSWTMNNSPSSSVTVTVQISDAALSAGFFVTAQQSIASVHLFIDRHPYDLDSSGNSPKGTPMVLDRSTGTIVASMPLSISDISKPTVGRHSLFVHGIDDHGYTGPVTAAFFDVVASEKRTRKKRTRRDKRRNIFKKRPSVKKRNVSS